MNGRARLPVVVDTTLRDGIQMPGAVLSFNAKAAIFDRLALLGISEAEIGCPAQGAGAVTEIRRLRERHPTVNCSTWCRARKDDIDAAAQTGVATIHISFPVSDCHMAIGGNTRKQVLKRLSGLIRYALSAAPRVTIGAQDASRADPLFLQLFITAAVDAGASRIRIADTVGSATPQSVSRIITAIKTTCPSAHLEFHGHNDFGLATANTLAAIEAGVDAVSVTVQGVGERAGNAPLEEIITAAVMLYGYTTSLRLEALDELCRTATRYFNLPEQPNKAICGSNAFRHESGIHCHGMLRDPLAYQPIDPAGVGRRNSYSIGEQSGYSSLRAVLRENGISIDEGLLRTLWKNRHG
jgi:homocitrate synthase NifV